MQRPDYDPILRSVIVAANASCDAAQRRLWTARDEVARLERNLSLAQRVLAEAERDYRDSRELLAENWNFFKSEQFDRSVN